MKTKSKDSRIINLTIRFSQNEKEYLQKLSEKRKMSIADIVRENLFNERGVKNE